MASLKRFSALGGAAPAATDPEFNLTTLLLHGDGTNGAQNNTFVDSSPNNFTITRNGNTTQGTFTPFSQTGWSNYFNVTSSYLSSTLGAGQAFGTGDFTVECFLNTAVSACNIMQPSASTSTWGFLTFNNNFYWQQGGANLFGTGSVPQNQWVHLAVSRSSGTLSAYVNGTRVYSAANTYDFTATPTRYIGPGSGGSAPFYLSNVRIIKGTGLYSGTIIAVPTAPLTAITNTVLLTCQSNRFVDNSINDFALTITGTPSVQAFSPFAPTSAYSTSVVGGSGYFDGVGDYLTVPSSASLSLGSGDYTVESWVYLTGTQTTTFGWGVFGTYAGAGNGWSITINRSSGSQSVVWILSNAIVASATTPYIPTDVWTHIAVTRNGTGTNNTKIFVNGAVVGQATNNTNDTFTGLTYIGGQGTGQLITGYISSSRVVKGTAVYTVNFTPPTAPLTAITNTSLLTNYTNAGIIDNTAKTNLETVGNAQISTSVKKFGTGSLAFDGSGDAIIVSGRGSSIAFGTGDFTIEFFAWINNAAVRQYLFDTSPLGVTNPNNRILIDMQNNGALRYITFQGVTVLITSSAGAVTANQWNHIALCKSSGQTRLFLNGTQVGSTYTDTLNYPAQINRPILGIDGYNLSSSPLNGYIDELRVSLYARYTANFTPPTAPFPNQ